MAVGILIIEAGCKLSSNSAKKYCPVGFRPGNTNQHHQSGPSSGLSDLAWLGGCVAVGLGGGIVFGRR